MKKLYFVAVLMLTLGLLSALMPYTMAIPTVNVTQKTKAPNLRNAVRELSQQGYEIYYYNDIAVIAGSPNNSFPGAKMLRGGSYYIVSKLGDARDALISKCGEVCYDLGTAYLLRTELKDVQLRERISNPFMLLDFEPMQFSKHMGTESITEASRTSIESLITQVNPDSVLYFIQSMQDMQTRYAMADNRLEVATWIKNQFLRFGITNAQLQQFSWNGTTQYNVVATIQGSSYPQEYIVVGGHHDSITNTTPLTFAPGADDNASGTAAALEMARVMMLSGYQPKCSIRFVTFAAEEFGLWGSKAYAQYAFDSNLSLRLMINHDMIANNTGDDNRVRLMPYDGFIEHTERAAQISTLYTDLDVTYGSMNSSSSDSHPFWAKGYPVIYYFEQNFSPVYHSNNDLTSAIDPDYCAEVIKASTAVAATYANKPGTPQGLQVRDQGTGTGLSVWWALSEDPNITQYKVSYTNTQTSVTLTQNVAVNICNLSGLQEGVEYEISVSSVDGEGTESFPVYGFGTPLSIPRAPLGFEVNPFNSSISLSWHPNTEVDLAGYYIWRSASAVDPGTLLATLNLPDFCIYNDLNLSGTLEYSYYRISAFDNAGNESAYSEVISCRPASMDQGILIVDETMGYDGISPLNPTEEMVDSFYAELFNGYNVSTVLDCQSISEPLRMADIGAYSAVFWHGNDTGDQEYPALSRDVLREYLNRGGKVLFSVYRPGTSFEQIGSYPMNFSPSSFIRQVLGISSADYTNSSRFKYAIPAVEDLPEMVVDIDKTLAIYNGHLGKVEVITPDEGADMLYSFGSDYAQSTPQGALNGQSVGVRHQYNSGDVVTLSFPLYNMNQEQAAALIDYVFGGLFNQPSSNNDLLSPALGTLSVFPGYPNPFRNSTSFTVHSKQSHIPLEVAIYNIRGQLVNTLYRGITSSTSTITWDGSDMLGKSVSSGIYFLKAKQGKESVSCKVLRLK